MLPAGGRQQTHKRQRRRVCVYSCTEPLHCRSNKPICIMDRNNNGKKAEESGSKTSDLHSCFGRVQIYEGTHSILKFYSQEDVGEVPVMRVIFRLQRRWGTFNKGDFRQRRWGTSNERDFRSQRWCKRDLGSSAMLGSQNAQLPTFRDRRVVPKRR